MFKVITEHSTYVIDPKEKRFKRIPDTSPIAIFNDDSWTPYISIPLCQIGEPMHIEWSHEGTRKIRNTTTVIDIDLLEE